MKTLTKTAKISAATMLAWLVAGIASAQTTGTSTGTTTPGVPNTGVGGDLLTNVLLLAISAAIALVGLAYLSRRWGTQS